MNREGTKICIQKNLIFITYFLNSIDCDKSNTKKLINFKICDVVWITLTVISLNKNVISLNYPK